MRLWEMVMTRFFLAKLAKQVYAFDIQKQALEKTQERLHQADLTNAQLILQGHETLDQFVIKAKAGILIWAICRQLISLSSPDRRQRLRH